MSDLTNGQKLEAQTQGTIAALNIITMDLVDIVGASSPVIAEALKAKWLSLSSNVAGRDRSDPFVAIVQDCVVATLHEAVDRIKPLE